jgi:hypothetical protein
MREADRVSAKKGYSILVDPDEGTVEWSRTTCGHCNRVIRIPGGKSIQDVAGWCWVEQKAICLSCKERAVRLGCEPFQKKLEESERRQRFLTSAGI